MPEPVIAGPQHLAVMTSSLAGGRRAIRAARSTVVSLRVMDTDYARPDDIAELRAVFAGGDTGASAMGWPGVHAFEVEHGIMLPEPYRTLIAEIADGSSSGPPDYGLLGVAEMPDDWGDDRPVRELAAPFPLTEAWLWEEGPRPPGAVEPLLSSVFDHGSIVLGTDGCGMYWHLIVTGPHRGHIWNITGEGAQPFGTEFGHTTAASGLIGWVRHWAAGKPWFDAA